MVVASLPADALAEATQKQFEWLRQRFLAGLEARWLDISQAADAASRQALLHRLCGSAGSFGFERLGQLARSAEGLCATGDELALADCLSRLDAEIKTSIQAMPRSDGL